MHTTKGTKGADPMTTQIDTVLAARERDIQRALLLARQGKSLFEIAMTTGRSKEWLRTYAGLS